MDKPEKEQERWRSDCCGVMLSLMPRIRALYSVSGEGCQVVEGRQQVKVEEEKESECRGRSSGRQGFHTVERWVEWKRKRKIRAEMDKYKYSPNEMTHKPLTKKGSYIFVPLGGTLELPNHFKEHRECRQCMEAGISECLAILTLTSFPLSPALHSSLSQRS